jgi:hypothetical protein
MWYRRTRSTIANTIELTPILLLLQQTWHSFSTKENKIWTDWILLSNTPSKEQKCKRSTHVPHGKRKKKINYPTEYQPMVFRKFNSIRLPGCIWSPSKKIFLIVKNSSKNILMYISTICVFIEFLEKTDIFWGQCKKYKTCHTKSLLFSTNFR